MDKRRKTREMKSLENGFSESDSDENYYDDLEDDEWKRKLRKK